jgi:hypothetical protein
MGNLNKYEIFGNLILQGLENTCVKARIFPDSFLPDINIIQDRLMKFSDQFILGHELNDLISYSNEHNFFQIYWDYLDSDDDDNNEVVVEKLMWYLSFGEKLLDENLAYPSDELSDFFLNAIFYSYLKNSKKGINKEKGKKFSYQWNGKPDELNDFFNRLKGGLISNDNELDDFIKVFSKVEINSNLKPIKWNNDVASEVLFFIKILMEKGLIEKSNRMDYRQLKLLFVKPDGNQFDENLKQLNQNLDINLSANKQDELNSLLDSFL